MTLILCGAVVASLFQEPREELPAGVVSPDPLQLGVILQEEGEVLIRHVHLAVPALHFILVKSKPNPDSNLALLKLF